LGGLKKIATLPDNRLPSGCKHSDILKNIMVNCNSLTFACEYLHVAAHQDERKSFRQLPRPTQLNCCMDTCAKAQLWGLEGTVPPQQGVFLLEPIAVYVGKDKMTSGLEDILRFWCQRKVAKEVMAHPKVNVLQPDQFEEVEWPAVYHALTEVPRMFQIWACKQVTGVAGTNEMQSRYTPNHDKHCPSCKVEIETCGHVLECEEAGRVDVLHQSVDLLDEWLRDKGTVGKLRRCLIEYAHGRGGKTMSEIVGWGDGEYRRLANLMDLIGWRRFMEGMVLKEVVAIQNRAVDDGRCHMTVASWSAGLVTKLLEVTHGQSLYQNVHVHDWLAGENAEKRKSEIRRELEYQLELGGEGLAEEDQYLLEINLDSIDQSTGEDQLYWLLALQTARKAWQLRQARRTAALAGGQQESGI